MIVSPQREQFVVGAGLNDLPVVQHHDLVDPGNRVQSVCDHQYGAVGGEFVDRRLHQVFRLWIGE